MQPGLEPALFKIGHLRPYLIKIEFENLLHLSLGINFDEIMIKYMYTFTQCVR